MNELLRMREGNALPILQKLMRKAMPRVPTLTAGVTQLQNSLQFRIAPQTFCDRLPDGC